MIRPAIGAIVILCVVLPLQAATIPASASIQVLENAVRAEAGEAVRMRVAISCTLEADEVILEAHLSASQDDASGIAGVQPVCTGHSRVYSVVVHSSGGAFERGPASGSAFMLVLNTTTQQTTQFSDTRSVTIR